MAGGVLRVLGVDPGSQVTGYGVLEILGARITLVCQGTVRPPAARPLPDRLLAIRDRLLQILTETAADEVAVETLFLGKNPRSAHVLAQVRGVVLLAAAQAGRPVFEYAPTQVKQAVTGYGRADKDQVRTTMGLLLAMAAPPRSRDAADALAAAWCHAARRGPEALAGLERGR